MRPTINHELLWEAHGTSGKSTGEQMDGIFLPGHLSIVPEFSCLEAFFEAPKLVLDDRAYFTRPRGKGLRWRIRIRLARPPLQLLASQIKTKSSQEHACFVSSTEFPDSLTVTKCRWLGRVLYMSFLSSAVRRKHNLGVYLVATDSRYRLSFIRRVSV